MSGYAHVRNGSLRKSAHSTTRSALPLLADLPRTDTQVRKVPISDIALA